MRSEEIEMFQPESNPARPSSSTEIAPSCPPTPGWTLRVTAQVAQLLEHADALIYAVVGICFILAAVIALGYSFWDFAFKLKELSNPNNNSDQPGIVASAIIKLVSDLLLIIIILEVLGTISEYLRSHVTSLTPFLYIGIISATRGILSIGARLSVETVSDKEFTNSMIELGANAGAILALGITLRLLDKHAEEGGKH